MGNEPRVFDKFYFYSDPHFFHSRICQLSNRSFSSVQEMNEALIENYNRAVPKDGTVIWTGDCFFIGRPKAKEIMDRLHGVKILVRGNHDMKPVDMYKIGFTFVCESMEMMIAGERVKVSHFPYKPKHTLWQKFLKLIRGPKRHYDLKYMNLRPVDNGGWLIHGHCLPTDYEVLTVNKGFVKLSDIQINEEVYAYDKDRIVRSRVIELTKTLYSGQMYDIQLPRFSQTMTANHHLKLKDNSYVSIKSCLDRQMPVSELPTYCNSEVGGSDIDIKDIELRLIVAICADGCFEKNSSPIRFHIKKERKQQRLKSLFQEYGETIYFYNNKSKGIDPVVGNYLKGLVLRNSTYKRLPEWFLDLSTRQIAVVIDELEHWDGNVSKTGVRQFFSSKKEEIDLVQILLTRLGIMSNSVRNKEVVTYKFHNNNSNASITKYTKEFLVENIEVGCITTEFQSFITRSPNGKISVTGNTHNPNKLNGKQIHVGVDSWNYAPIPYQQIEIIINRAKKI